MDICLAELFDSLADMALQIAPFEGAAIGLVDHKQVQGLGGAGIFDGDKVRRHLTPRRSGELGQDQPPRALEAAVAKLESGMPGEPQAAGCPGELTQTPVGIAFSLADVVGELRGGRIKIVRDVYVEGHEARQILAIPLNRTIEPVGELIGLLVLNNRRGDRAGWESDPPNPATGRLLINRISATVTEYAQNPDDLSRALQGPCGTRLFVLPSATAASPSDQEDAMSRRMVAVFAMISACAVLLGFASGAAFLASYAGADLCGIQPGLLSAVGVAAAGFSVELLLGAVWLSRSVRSLDM